MMKNVLLILLALTLFFAVSASAEEECQSGSVWRNAVTERDS